MYSSPWDQHFRSGGQREPGSSVLAPGEVELAGGGGTGYGLSPPTMLHTSQGSRSPASTLVWEESFTFWKSSAKSAQVQSWPTRLLRLQHLPLSVYLVTSYLRKCECFFSSNIPFTSTNDFWAGTMSQMWCWIREHLGKHVAVPLVK